MISLIQCSTADGEMHLTGVQVDVSEAWVREHFDANASGRIIFDTTAYIPIEVWHNLGLPDLKLDLVALPPLEFKETTIR